MKVFPDMYMMRYIYDFFGTPRDSLREAGISAYYEAPKSSRYPSELDAVKPGCEETVQEKSVREAYNRAQRDFEEKSKSHNRNVSIISLVAAIAILVASLTLPSKIKMIADGILLGGVFSAIYSIIRGLMGEDTKFRFFIVAVGLIITLILGYIKFIRPKEKERRP